MSINDMSMEELFKQLVDSYGNPEVTPEDFIRLLGTYGRKRYEAGYDDGVSECEEDVWWDEGS